MEIDIICIFSCHVSYFLLIVVPCSGCYFLYNMLYCNYLQKINIILQCTDPDRLLVLWWQRKNKYCFYFSCQSVRVYYAAHENGGIQKCL